jgi:flavin-dependent dehydrogenase
MTRQFSADVIVVGAGTAGTLFAWRMAQRGYQVVLLEGRAFAELGKAIEIIHMELVRFDEFDIPQPELPELIQTETLSYTYSPDLKVKLPIRGTFHVVNMPAFMQRLRFYALSAGADLHQQAVVESLILNGDKLVGVKGSLKGEAFEAYAALIVDASGLAGAVRTKLPEAFGVENKPVPAEKCLYVCLELRANIPQGFPTGSNGYMFHKAFWNKSYGEDVVLGIGQPLSFDYAWKRHREWREEYFGDPGEVVGRRQGAIPFTRTPFSLVGNGLMIIGDAANQNKTFSGEGITSGFTAVTIAVDVADKALKAGDTSAGVLWDYNVRYQRGQGAKFAASLAQLPAAAELTRKDVNYLFRKGIIFSSADFEELNRNFELQMSLGKLLKIALILVWGVLTGQFKGSSLKKFLQASSQAGNIKKHYLQYPADPAQFGAWVKEAKRLWHE